MSIRNNSDYRKLRGNNSAIKKSISKNRGNNTLKKSSKKSAGHPHHYAQVSHRYSYNDQPYRSGENDVRDLNLYGDVVPVLPSPSAALQPEYKERLLASDYDAGTDNTSFPLVENFFKQYLLDDNGDMVFDPKTNKPIELENRDTDFSGESSGMRLSAKKDADAEYMEKIGQKKEALTKAKSHSQEILKEAVAQITATAPPPLPTVKITPNKADFEKDYKPNKDLPALIERNDYLPDGSNVFDSSIFHAGEGYRTVRHRMSMDIYRIITDLQPFLSKNAGETPPRQQGLEVVPLDFEPSATKPLRSYLQKKGYDIKKIDDLMVADSVFFRNNDFGIDQLKKMDGLMGALKVALGNKTELKQYLESLPRSDRDPIKEPFELYSSKMMNTLQKVVKSYDKQALNKPTDYIRRVLLDHKNIIAFDKAIKGLGGLDITKNNNHLLSNYRKIAEHGVEFLKLLRTITSYSENAVFTPMEMMKYTSELPSRTSFLLNSLAGVGQDPYIKEFPEFEEKFSNIVFALDKILEGPMKKDLDIWHSARKNTDPIPLSNDYTDNVTVTVKNPTASERSSNMSMKIKNSTPSVGIEATALNVNQKQAPLSPSPRKNATSEPASHIMVSSNKQKNNPSDKNINKKKQAVDEPNYIKYTKVLPGPSDITRPLGAGEQIRPAPFDDPFLRETQNLAEWADYASKMKQKLDTLDQIGRTVHDMAVLSTGRPDPEHVALKRRQRRLNDLKEIVDEVPKTNKITQQIERGTLKAQHEYVKGVGQILSDRLNLQSEEANQRARLDQMAAKSATGLASKALETSLILEKQAENMFNAKMQTLGMMNDNTWTRIKSVVRGFKY